MLGASRSLAKEDHDGAGVSGSRDAKTGDSGIAPGNILSSIASTGVLGAWAAKRKKFNDKRHKKNKKSKR